MDKWPRRQQEEAKRSKDQETVSPGAWCVRPRGSHPGHEGCSPKGQGSRDPWSGEQRVLLDDHAPCADDGKGQCDERQDTTNAPGPAGGQIEQFEHAE